MRAARRYSTMPDNADKVLFAEDLVNHILHRLKLPLLSSGIADHRALIYNGFNSQVRHGASYTFRCMEEEVTEEFDNILKENAIDSTAFSKYVIPLTFCHIMEPSEVGAHHLLQFSVRISMMAGKFYRHGFLDAPVLAVDYIIRTINDIDMTDGYWQALNTVAANYAQCFIDMDNYLTPESASDYESESDSLSTLSSKNSEKSRSPDREMEGEDGKDEHQEDLIDNNHSNLHISCMGALGPYEEPVPSIPDCKHVEETDDVKADNILSSSDSSSDPGTWGSSTESSDASFYSFELASSEEDCSAQITQKIPNKPFYPHSKEHESDVNLHETDLETAGLMTGKSSATLSSPVNELYKSSSSHQLEPSYSDYHTGVMNTSLMDEGDGLQSCRAKSSPVRSPAAKRRK